MLQFQNVYANQIHLKYISLKSPKKLLIIYVITIIYLKPEYEKCKDFHLKIYIYVYKDLGKKLYNGMKLC